MSNEIILFSLKQRKTSSIIKEQMFDVLEAVMKAEENTIGVIHTTFSEEYEDIFSIELNGVLYINNNYNRQKYGSQLFDFTM